MVRDQNSFGSFSGPCPFTSPSQLLQEIGVRYAIDFVQRFGLSKESMYPNLSMALGTGTVTPLEITRARVPEPGFHELVFGAGTVLPDRALALGLVHEVAPADEVLPHALAHATRLAAIPAQAFSLTKQLVVGPVLARTREAAAIDAAVTRAWEQPGVLEPMRRYVEGLKQKSRT